MTARPLRVAFLNGSLDLGGSERQMVEIALRMPRDRFDIEFVLQTHGGVLAPVAERQGITVHVLGWARAGDPHRRLRRPGDLLRFIRLLRRQRYDIVDAWLFRAYALAVTTRPLTRVPIVIAGRRSLSDFKVGIHPAYRLLDAIARRWSDAIVANSEAVRRDVSMRERISPDRIEVIRNGIVLPPPMSPATRALLRAAWGVGADGLVVGCVANYKSGKGLELLIDVAEDLRARHPRMTLVLVGEGSLRGKLEQQLLARHLTQTVRLHGAAADARELYGAFDIAAFASESEGLPNAVLEAAAAGLPVVATRAGGTPEIIEDGVGGSLVEIGDRQAFGAALDRMLEDGEWRARAGSMAREAVANRFAMDRLLAETASLWERLAAAKGIRR